MTARDDLERAAWEALAVHGRAIAGGTPARIADPALIDAVIKAADTYLLAAVAATAERAGATPAERRHVLHQARTDIGRQPTYGTAALR